MACAKVLEEHISNRLKTLLQDNVCLFFHDGKIKIKKNKTKTKTKLQHFSVSALCCLHMMIIAAQFSVEKSQISYMYIYNITLVPANMAVNGVFFRVRRWNWCVESLHKEIKKGSAAILLSPCEFPNRRLFFSSYATHYLLRDRVCVCVREHRKPLEVSTGGR